MNRAAAFSRATFALSLLAILLLTTPLFPQQAKPGDSEAEGLQKASQNPVSSLISVPIQNNSNFGVGPNSRIQNVLNVQPVIPLNISKNWNLVIRWITPIISQPAPGTQNLELFGIEEDTPAFFAATEVQKTAGVYGFGDMTPTFFLSPAKPAKLIWGVGPVFLLPTATGRVLGQGKFGIGPSVVALVQPGHWTIGALINNIWSVAGDADRTDVNQMSWQYFINYNLKKGWYISVSPTITANWKASSGSIWLVPVGGGVGRILRLGMQPVNISASFFGNPVRPTNASTWSMRLQISFMFPKGPKKQ